jgi:hypothetical protein
MSLKLFIAVFFSSLFSAFPQNIIGCGPTPDPYDYYTTFFSKEIGGINGYRPFYYTALLRFYDDWNWDAIWDPEHDPILKEWKQYCNASAKEAYEFVYKLTAGDIRILSSHIQKNTPLSLPDSIRTNGMTRCLLDKKNLPLLSYLEFAKTTEKFSAEADWDKPVEKDSLAINKFINEANSRYQQTNDPFLKNKYAFQRCKLAFYNNRFNDCIRWYNEHFREDNNAAVKTLALSYKAGSYFRSGRNKEAAYFFSKVFPLSPDKKQTFLGFFWATEQANAGKKQEYLAFCKTDKERADMEVMYSLSGPEHRLNNLEKIYKLDPASFMLPLLTVREINKFEEQYFTPLLASQKGGKALYLSWTDENTGLTEEKAQLEKTISFVRKLGEDTRVNNRSFYLITTAYLMFMNGNEPGVADVISRAEKLQLNNEQKDQLTLIRLLVMANDKKRLDAATEKEILPSLIWLTKKAKANEEYAIFCRNFFSEILAQKYQEQGDDYRAALSYGVADMNFLEQLEDENMYSYPSGLEFIRNEMNSAQLLKLNELLGGNNQTAFEQFLTSHSSFKKDAVTDVIGTSYFRDHNYQEAVKWLKQTTKPLALIHTRYNYKTDKETLINVDPFHDYLNDWNRYDKTLTKPLTKLSLAEKLIELQKSLDTARNQESQSRLYYKLASAYYNMSFYGNSWQAVAYDRSGIDWNTGKYDASWQKEYYGVYKAGELYQKAYVLTKDKEFRAAALFMMAKCAQRQIPRPEYNYDYANPDQYETRMAAFQKKFMTNPLFSKFIQESGSTKFYKYTISRCSYLLDFVNSPGEKKKN